MGEPDKYQFKVTEKWSTHVIFDVAGTMINFL